MSNKVEFRAIPIYAMFYAVDGIYIKLSDLYAVRVDPGKAFNPGFHVEPLGARPHSDNTIAWTDSIHGDRIEMDIPEAEKSPG